MKTQTSTKLIGGFVIGALALIIVVFVIFGSGKLFQDTIPTAFYFHGDAIGLRVGAPIKVRGVDIGMVKTISPIYDREGNIMVEVLADLTRGSITDAYRLYEDMDDDKFITLMLEQGLRARMETQSLVTGVRYIKLDFFPEFPAELVGLRPDVWEIPTVPTTQEQLEQTFRKVITKLGEVEWDEIEKDFEILLEGVKNSLETVNTTIQSLDVEETIDSINRNLDTIEDMFTNINSKLDPLVDEQVNPLLGDFRNVAEAATKTLEQSQKMMIRLENIAVDDRYEIQAALKEFAETNRSLRVLLDYIQQNPESIIRGKKDRRQP
jgi:paraquat-inducible protein B